MPSRRKKAQNSKADALGPEVNRHYEVMLGAEDDFEGWRDAARRLASAGVRPESISWMVEGQSDLLGALGSGEALPSEGAEFAVRRAFLDLARRAACHSDPERFALLYSLLFRLRSDRHAMEDRADPLLHRVERLAREVRRDAHKMHAFLRFREMPEPDGATRFVAWFEPEHHIVRSEAGFFVRRFTNMRWSILTPELSLHWDGTRLEEGPGASRGDAPGGDPVEEIWKSYYASIFNPARLKVGAMLKEMPKKYWRNMPETSLIGELVAGARARETAMIERSADDRPAVPVEPPSNLERAWQALRAEAQSCTRCSLHRCATQTVFGEGPLDASILFVGEQPGDQEDLAGKPFVGPAGQLWNEALEEAGIDRARTYVTNAVKHFKFQLRGKRRLHARPGVSEIEACRWWLDQELGLVRPAVTVALGATAARALFGRQVTVSSLRGAPHRLASGLECWVTIHPSALLRTPDEDARREGREAFVADLLRIRERAAALA